MTNQNNNKTGSLIAMSGGVDSSVAALLATREYPGSVGGMMRLFPNYDCGDFDDAKSVADKLRIDFHIFDLTAHFQKQVIERFINSYQNGETPNPCVDCNRHLKFGRLQSCAAELDKEYIVTGHYSQIELDKGSNRYILKKSIDLTKDQSYVLYSLNQEQLKRTRFPLGGMCKKEVREIAAEHKLINAKKKDSQDICFIPDGKYRSFIRSFTGEEVPKGDFIDTDGNIIGEHNGIINYTVGQRKGLGLISPTPLYVCEVCAKNNTVIVGGADKLFASTLIAKDINLIAVSGFCSDMKIKAKIRYNQTEQPATVTQLDSDTLRIQFDEPQRAITKGQAVVMYDGDIVLGGGTIKEVFN
jgi:tRNA-specific 2-thiouridylase